MTDPDVNLDETVDTITHGLLERAKSRDEEAWERLVYLYSPLVYQWCRKAGLEPNSAADVGQEVFTAVARKISDFKRDSEGGTFRGWIRTVTQNKLNDYWRRLRNSAKNIGSDVDAFAAPTADEVRQSGPVDDDSKVLFRRIVEFVRSQFSNEDWQAFWRSTVDRLPAAQVAEELNCTTNKVYLAKSRIMKRIRQEFQYDSSE